MYEEINRAVTMAQVVSLFNIKINRSGFIACPFHNGDHTPSLKIYDNSFYCFGCGKGGNVINFVQEMQRTSAREACEFLDNAFSLGIVEQKQGFLQYRQAKKRASDYIIYQNAQARAEQYDLAQFVKLCAYRRWLASQTPTQSTAFDIDYIDRILDQDYLITFDAGARINALLTKHPNGGEFLLE